MTITNSCKKMLSFVIALALVLSVLFIPNTSYAADEGPSVTVLGATIRLTDRDNDGTQAMRIGIQINNANKAYDCAIQLTIGSKTYTVATSSEKGDLLQKKMHSISPETNSVVYAVVLNNIPKTEYFTNIGIVGKAWDKNDQVYTSDLVTKNVAGVVATLQEKYPLLDITIGSDGCLYKNDGAAKLTAADINNYSDHPDTQEEDNLTSPYDFDYVDKPEVGEKYLLLFSNVGNNAPDPGVYYNNVGTLYALKSTNTANTFTTFTSEISADRTGITVDPSTVTNVTWTVEAYNNSDSEFMFKNEASGQYLSFDNGNLAYADAASVNTAWTLPSRTATENNVDYNYTSITPVSDSTRILRISTGSGYFKFGTQATATDGRNGSVHFFKLNNNKITIPTPEPTATPVPDFAAVNAFSNGKKYIIAFNNAASSAANAEFYTNTGTLHALTDNNNANTKTFSSEISSDRAGIYVNPADVQSATWRVEAYGDSGTQFTLQNVASGQYLVNNGGNAPEYASEVTGNSAAWTLAQRTATNDGGLTYTALLSVSDSTKFVRISNGSTAFRLGSTSSNTDGRNGSVYLYESAEDDPLFRQVATIEDGVYALAIKGLTPSNMSSGTYCLSETPVNSTTLGFAAFDESADSLTGIPLWKIEKAPSGYTIRNITGSAKDYLNVISSTNQASLGEYQVLSIVSTGSNNEYRIQSGSRYLRFTNSSGSGFTSGTNNSSSNFSFFKVRADLVPAELMPTPGPTPSPSPEPLPPSPYVVNLSTLNVGGLSRASKSIDANGSIIINTNSDVTSSNKAEFGFNLTAAEYAAGYDTVTIYYADGTMNSGIGIVEHYETTSIGWVSGERNSGATGQYASFSGSGTLTIQGNADGLSAIRFYDITVANAKLAILGIVFSSSRSSEPIPTPAPTPVPPTPTPTPAAPQWNDNYETQAKYELWTPGSANDMGMLGKEVIFIARTDGGTVYAMSENGDTITKTDITDMYFGDTLYIPTNYNLNNISWTTMWNKASGDPDMLNGYIFQNLEDERYLGIWGVELSAQGLPSGMTQGNIDYKKRFTWKATLYPNYKTTNFMHFDGTDFDADSTSGSNVLCYVKSYTGDHAVKNTWHQVDHFTTGRDYLIVTSNTPGTVRAFNMTGTGSGSYAGKDITVNADGTITYNGAYNDSAVVNAHSLSDGTFILNTWYCPGDRQTLSYNGDASADRSLYVTSDNMLSTYAFRFKYASGALKVYFGSSGLGTEIPVRWRTGSDGGLRIGSASNCVNELYIFERDITPQDYHVSGREYSRITDPSQIQDGDKILMIFDGQATGTNFGPEFMIPVGTEINNRIGFEVVSTDIAMASSIYGDAYQAYEWTFTRSGSGWKVGTTAGEVKFTDVSGKGITATLETTGDVLTMDGNGLYTFYAGEFCFNRNTSRTLINAYRGEAAHFYLYRYAG